MKKIFNIAICAAAVFAMTSCEKFFTREPINEFSAETYFSSESELKMYTDGMLNAWIPDYTETDGDDAYNDLIATKTSTDYFRADVTWDDTKQGSWSWTWLRRINYMIDGMAKNAKDKVTESTYNHYLGLARFWRAYWYFDRVKIFSDLPWCEKYLQPTDTVELYGKRDDREFVMSKVVEDLKFACENVDARVHSSDAKSRNQVDKYVVNAMAARILLYEGTFRKNVKVNPATNKPWTNQYNTPDQLLELAAKYAKVVMDEGGFKLHGNWKELFLSNELCTDEVIWGQVFILESNGRHAYTRYFNSSTMGQQYSGTKELVHHFLNADGTPIATDQVSILEESKGRDPRLEGTILFPGHMVADLQGKQVEQAINCTFCWTAYMLVKWCVPDQSHWQNSVDENCIPIIRYPEVLLIYAEAMNELGKMTQSIWDQTVGAIRTRAGVKNIYPTSSDPWLKAYYTEGLENQHITDGNEAVALEIRRERVTELCFEAESRQPDLYRWGICDIIPRRSVGNNLGWRGIWMSENEVNNGFTFAGTKYLINTSVKKGSETGYPITGNNNSCWSLEKAGNGYYLQYNYKLKWEPRMYCRPIPSSAKVVNPNLGENYGW